MNHCSGISKTCEREVSLISAVSFKSKDMQVMFKDPLSTLPAQRVPLFERYLCVEANGAMAEEI